MNLIQYEEYFEGSLRSMVESCDNLQCFHFLTDVNDGFGGFGSALLEAVREEYSKKTVLTFGSRPATDPRRSTKV